jgi:hypothetical protein
MLFCATLILARERYQLVPSPACEKIVELHRVAEQLCRECFERAIALPHELAWLNPSYEHVARAGW